MAALALCTNLQSFSWVWPQYWHPPESSTELCATLWHQYFHVLQHLPVQRITIIDNRPASRVEWEPLEHLPPNLRKCEFAVHHPMGSYRSAALAVNLVGETLTELELGGTHGRRLTDRTPRRPHARPSR